MKTDASNGPFAAKKEPKNYDDDHDFGYQRSSTPIADIYKAMFGQ